VRCFNYYQAEHLSRTNKANSHANNHPQGEEIMNINELTVMQRVNRVLIGAVMIIATMAAPFAPLGWLAVLPLIATYPIFAGMFGYDPLMSFLEYEAGKAIHRVAGYHGEHTPRHS
jgi:hypothetical protein